MHTIYKFDVDKVPEMSVIKHIGWDTKVENVQVWAELFVPYSETKYKDLVVIGTGHNIPFGYKHISTVIEPTYALVWHVYGKLPNNLGEVYAISKGS